MASNAEEKARIYRRIISEMRTTPKGDTLPPPPAPKPALDTYLRQQPAPSPVPQAEVELPEDYVLVNSPTEGVFLRNKKNAKAMPLDRASRIPGFEGLVEEGMLANQALLRKGLGK